MLIRALSYVTHRLCAALFLFYLFNTFVQPALGIQAPLASQAARILDGFDAILKALGDPPDDGSR